MDIISDKAELRRKILIIWSLCTVALHLIYIPLNLFNAYISGDIMQKGLEAFLGIILNILSLIIVYMRYGVLVSAYHSYKKGTLPFTVFGIISLLLTRICELIIYAAVYSDFAQNLLYYLSGLATNFMIELAIIIILLLLSRSHKEQSRTVTRLSLFACLIPCGAVLTEELFIFIKFLMDIKRDYGSMAMTGDEIISVLSAFGRPLLEALIGYGIIRMIHLGLKKISK